jgi:8-oxo-dGTP diphosphatase
VVELSHSKVRERRSARVILLDDAGRVLLIRFSMPRHGTMIDFWATPGGQIETGETERSAAERELWEELRLRLDLTGPVHRCTDSFEHEGVLTKNTDIFFLGRSETDYLEIGGVTAAERSAMQNLKWWSLKEIDSSSDTIYPRELAAVISRLT